MALHTRVGGRAFGRRNEQGKGLQHGRVGRGVAGGVQHRLRCTGQALVEVQREAGVARCVEQCVGQLVALPIVQQCRAQPGRLVAVQNLAGLRLIAGPEDIAGGRVGPIISGDEAQRAFDQRGGPEIPRRGGDDFERREVDSDVLRRRRQRVEKGLPHGHRLGAVQALKDHGHVERVVGSKSQLLAPVRADEALGAEVKRQADESAKGRIRRRAHREVHRAEALGQRVHAQSQARDDAEAGAAAAFEGPEKLRLGAGVGDADLAVGGDDFSLEQVTRCRAEGLRKTAEAAALHEARDAHGHAAATLHVAAAACGHGVVGLRPKCTCANAHCTHRRAGAAARHKGIVQADSVQVARPDQQRIGRVGGALVAVAAAFDDQPQALHPRKIHRRHDMLCASSGHGPDAGRGGPGIDPSVALRQCEVVAQRIGVLWKLEQLLAGAAVSLAATSCPGRFHSHQSRADLGAQALPLRFRRPRRVRWPHAWEQASCGRGNGRGIGCGNRGPRRGRRLRQFGGQGQGSDQAQPEAPMRAVVAHTGHSQPRCTTPRE